jgi:hypothetical protein
MTARCAPGRLAARRGHVEARPLLARNGGGRRSRLRSGRRGYSPDRIANLAFWVGPRPCLRLDCRSPVAGACRHDGRLGSGIPRLRGLRQLHPTAELPEWTRTPDGPGYEVVIHLGGEAAERSKPTRLPHPPASGASGRRDRVVCRPGRVEGHGPRSWRLVGTRVPRCHDALSVRPPVRSGCTSSRSCHASTMPGAKMSSAIRTGSAEPTILRPRMC